MNLPETLEKLGLTAHESKVYVALLQHGQATPALLGKLTELNRTTVYGICKNLWKRGVVHHELGAKTVVFSAEPEGLRHLVEHETKALDEKKSLVQKTIAELGKIALSASYALPRVSFVPQERLERHLYKMTPTWNASALQRDKSWWGFQDYTFVEHYWKWINEFWNEPTTKKLQATNMITNRAPIEEKMEALAYPKRSVKFWDDASDFTASLWIAGDYLIFSATREQPHYLLEICDAPLAHNARAVLKQLWKTL